MTCTAQGLVEEVLASAGVGVSGVTGVGDNSLGTTTPTGMGGSSGSGSSKKVIGGPATRRVSIKSKKSAHRRRSSLMSNPKFADASLFEKTFGKYVQMLKDGTRGESTVRHMMRSNPMLSYGDVDAFFVLYTGEAVREYAGVNSKVKALAKGLENPYEKATYKMKTTNPFTKANYKSASALPPRYQARQEESVNANARESPARRLSSTGKRMLAGSMQ
jgi:hypothetical protein